MLILNVFPKLVHKKNVYLNYYFLKILQEYEMSTDLIFDLTFMQNIYKQFYKVDLNNVISLYELR